MHKSSTGPILLILFGSVFLLSNFGFLPWEIWTNVWKFWPIFLILIGIEILIGRSASFKTLVILAVLVFIAPMLILFNPLSGNPLGTKSVDFAKPLGTTTKAKLIFDLPTSNIKIQALESSSGSLFKGKITYSQLNSEPELVEKPGFGSAQFSFTQKKKPPLPLLGNINSSAKFAISALIPIELEFRTVTGTSSFDLTNLKIDLLDFQGALGTISLKLAKDYSSKVFIKTTAAVLNFEIPKEIGVRIKSDSLIKQENLSQKGFKRVDSFYQTGNFDTSTNKTDIEIVGSASSLTVK